jgi:hypothetical protein
MRGKRDYLPLAALPLFFGIQQAVEGFLWIGLDEDNLTLVKLASQGFLFFSHFLWLFWIPFCAFRLEKSQLLKKSFWLLSIVGFMFGTLLYVPLFKEPSWVNIQVKTGSIYYQTHFLFDSLTPKNFSFLVYALIILVPLLMSSNPYLNRLGSLISLSVVVTYIFYHHAFISVWCFFAAVSSLYLFYIFNRLAHQAQASVDSPQVNLTG